MSLIIVLGLVLRLIASQTPFLGEWDERFHALVAKNLIEHPLKPTLYDEPVLEYDHKEWSWNHIWLSKPPLPLWLMAGSMSIFGIDELSLRLPSIIFSTLCIYLTFLIAKQLYNREIGIYAAFFHAIHGMTIEVAAGRLSSDHVETTFLFFFELGLLFIIKFHQKKNIRPLESLLIGGITGLAFMSKWTAAGFIPIIWVVLGINFGSFRSIKMFLSSCILVGIGGILVAGPWVAFIFYSYPTESMYMFQSIFTPITETIQGHSHPWYYYLDNVRIIYGELIYIPLTWIIYKFYKSPNRQSRISLICLIFIPMILLSSMETKRVTYILMCSVGIFTLSGLFFNYLLKYRKSIKLPKQLTLIILVLLVILPIRYSIERIKPFKSFEQEKEIGIELKSHRPLLPSDSLVVLFNEPNPIRCMFYLNNVTAYPWTPNDDKLKNIKDKGYVIFIRNDNALRKW